MARLPVVGADDDAWGTILNEFLEVAHNADGTIKTASIEIGDLAFDPATQAELDAVVVSDRAFVVAMAVAL